MGDPNPVPNTELLALLEDSAQALPTMKGNRPDWNWMAAQVYGIMYRAIEDRPTVTSLDIATVVRTIMLAAYYRLEATVADLEAPRRERWMSCLYRLARELPDTNPTDWRDGLHSTI